MRKNYTALEWAMLGQIVNATIELQNRLEEKGYEVINSFATRTDSNSIVFIVYSESPYAKNLEACVFDLLNNQDELQKVVFEPAEVLLEIDPKQVEKEALKKRLAELENNG